MTRSSGELIEEVGLALYGPVWRTRLADDLGVTYETVRKWRTEVAAVPDGVWSDLLSRTIERGNRLANLCDPLFERVSQTSARRGSIIRIEDFKR